MSRLDEIQEKARGISRINRFDRIGQFDIEDIFFLLGRIDELQRENERLRETLELIAADPSPPDGPPQ